MPSIDGIKIRFEVIWNADAGLDATRRRICEYWRDARLSEGQAAHLLGMTRTEARVMAEELGVAVYGMIDEAPVTETLAGGA